MAQPPWRIGLPFARVGAEYGGNAASFNHMTAIKKITKKSTKSPAPATKTVKTATGAKGSRAVATAPARKAARPATPVKAVSPKPAVTVISAKIDAGFGNALYVRGEGPGLSWDRGTLMNCIGDDEWQLTLGESSRPFTFKFLVNDLSWSAGPDYVMAGGTSLVVTPSF